MRQRSGGEGQGTNTKGPIIIEFLCIQTNPVIIKTRVGFRYTRQQMSMATVKLICGIYLNDSMKDPVGAVFS